jgi:hypothetical protein
MTTSHTLTLQAMTLYSKGNSIELISILLQVDVPVLERSISKYITL